MARLEKSGFKKFWPMKELVGHDTNGKKIFREVFRNMETGEVHVPVDKSGNFLGWNGEPTGAIPDQLILTTNDLYRKNFGLIRWEAGV